MQIHFDLYLPYQQFLMCGALALRQRILVPGLSTSQVFKGEDKIAQKAAMKRKIVAKHIDISNREALVIRLHQCAEVSINVGRCEDRTGARILWSLDTGGDGGSVEVETVGG